MAYTFSYPDFTYNLATTVTVDISNTFVPSRPSPIYFTITPTLPNNLSINNSTGSIQGTPDFLSISPLITYTVDASFNSTNIQTTLQISVNFIPGFSYPFSPYLLEKDINKSIIPVYFIGNLIGISYSLVSLPLLSDISLNLNTTNGVISGAPNIVSPSTNYTIRANNGGVIYDTSLFIGVETLPTISYPNLTYILNQGIPINIAPFPSYSGAGISYNIDGCALPTGLTLNTQTGEIDGTPLLPTTFREYTITVTNAIGGASTQIIINVIKEILAPRVFGENADVMISSPAYSMRRKAEILQYKQNSSQLSEKTKYSLMVQGKGPYAKRVWGNQGDRGTNPNISGLPQEGNTIICNSSPIICNPTSSSDVPGPITTLCYDPSVPLVGYMQPNRNKVNIGFRWPQRGWSIGDMGFPVGKRGNDQ
jgi:hypothetical protein